MSSALTPLQEEVQRTVRDFALAEIVPRAEETDRTDVFPRDLYRRLGEARILSLSLSPEMGGRGADTVCWSLAMEELARASAAVANMLHLARLMADFLATASPRFSAYAGAIGRGEVFCAYAQTEAEAGSDVAAIQTTAERRANGYVLNGAKTFVTGAEPADLFVVIAATGSGQGHRGLSAFLVEGDRAGLRRGPRTPLLGLRGLGTGELQLEECWVPPENLIGEEGEGFKRAMRMLDVGRIGIASMALGISAAAFDAALSYAKTRKQFGQPIADFQAIQFLLADMDTKLAAARLLTHQAAALRDAGAPFGLEAARAKLFATEVAMELASDALQVHGGHGYVTSAPVQRYFRDAKATQIIEGTNQIQRLVIARRLLREG